MPIEQDFLFSTQSWFAFLDKRGQILALESQKLYERELRLQSAFDDFSFVVFPLAKAYEGFLKLYLKRLGVLSQPGYSDTKFRIGRALNPDVSSQHQDQWWLYDDLVQNCGEHTARVLWDAWIDCRNHVFHFFFEEHTMLTLVGARKKLLQMSTAMEEAMACIQR